MTTFTLGTVETQVGPTASGRFDVYVPIVDWGVRARPYGAPLAVDLQFRSLDRDAALAAVRSGPAAQRNVRLLENELRGSVNAGFRRAALAGARGRALGGFLAGAIAVAFGRRRRWLPVGTGHRLATSVTAVVLAGLALVDRRLECAPPADLLRARLGAAAAPLLLRPDPHSRRDVHGFLRSRGRGAGKPHLRHGAAAFRLQR